jgi:chromosome partitioning protein
VNDSYLRQRSREKKGPEPETGTAGRRLYTADDIQSLRVYLDETGKAQRRYLPTRKEGEHLQVIAVVNFKGGSGKTTSAAHLAQHLALQGYRVLAVDLDPQASLSALHGYQPEFDVEENGTLYGAIRYDEHRRELTDIVRRTYFPLLDIVPANIELMEFEHETPKALAQRTTSSSRNLSMRRRKRWLSVSRAIPCSSRASQRCLAPSKLATTSSSSIVRLSSDS